MATVTFDRETLYGFLGRKIQDDELSDISFRYGMEMEPSDDDIDFEITPQRPDMFSVIGYARAIGNYLESNKNTGGYTNQQSDVELLVDPKVEKVRPFIVAGITEDVNFSDNILKAMIQFQEKIHSSYGRKRRKAAIGIYDFDKTKPPIHYTTVKPDGIKFVPLDFSREMTPEEILMDHPKGQEFAHLIAGHDEYPLLVDSAGNVLSLPPIINSDYTGKVTETTRRIFIEVTGHHTPTLMNILNMLSSDFCDLGGKMYKVKIIRNGTQIETPDLTPKKMYIDIEFIRQVTGLDFSPEEISNLLKRMGYESVFDERFAVYVPPYRTDVLHPIDVIEDIAIAYGYDNIEPREPFSFSIGEEHAVEEYSNVVRRTAEAMGFAEAMTLILSNIDDQYPRMLRNFDHNYIEIENPRTSTHSTPRNMILPELLKMLKANKHRELPIKLFEVGDVVIPDDSTDTGAKDTRVLSLVSMHSKARFSEIRSYTDRLLEELGIDYTVQPCKEPYYLNGRGGAIIYNGQEIGNFGEVHPQVLENFGLEEPVVSMEIDISRFKLIAEKSIEGALE
jgi:phenylalanyl-tRNA synthetase beta chain